MLDTLIQPVEATRPSLLDRARQRRRLRRIDRLGDRLTRIDSVERLLVRVHERLAAGWTQDAWFVTLEEDGVRRHVGSLRPEKAGYSASACLVAAVAIEASPGSVTGPDAQRAIGALWNVLHGGAQAADWSTPPAVTTARAYDLIHWNDGKDRRQSDVLALVSASRAAVSRSAAATRAELASA